MGENTASCAAPSGIAALSPKKARLHFSVSELENGYLVHADGVQGEFRPKQMVAISDEELLLIIKENVLGIDPGAMGKHFRQTTR